MKNKKILSLVLSLCVIGASTSILSISANADTKTENEITVVQPRTAGSVVVTAKSGANIRSYAGTNYRIIGTLAKAKF